jgi:hypothetical protein
MSDLGIFCGIFCGIVCVYFVAHNYFQHHYKNKIKPFSTSVATPRIFSGSYDFVTTKHKLTNIRLTNSFTHIYDGNAQKL